MQTLQTNRGRAAIWVCRNQCTLIRPRAFILAVLVACAGLCADDAPLRGEFPPEGSWVRYDFRVKDLLPNEVVFGNAEVEFLVKVLGTEMQEGAKCRWLEVAIKAEAENLNGAPYFAGANGSGSIKVLVREDGLRQSDLQVKIYKLISKNNRDAPPVESIGGIEEEFQLLLGLFIQSFSLLDERLIRAEPLPEPLIEPISKLRGFQLADKDDAWENQLRALPAAALAIRSREKRQISTAKGMKDGHWVQLAVGAHIADEWKPEFELGPDVPFGIQSIKFVFRFPEDMWVTNSPVVDFTEFELKAVDFGKGAKSDVPAIP